MLRKWGSGDGKEPFKFWKAYSGGNYFGEPKAFSIREYFILNALAPSLKLSYDSEELPISVKPDKPVAVTDVMALLRQTYEGTEWDMTKNLKVAVKNKETKETDTITSPAANPWMGTDMLNMLNGVKEGTVTRNRLVADSAMFLLARDTASQLVAGCSGRRCLAVVRQSGAEPAYPDLLRYDRPAGCFRYLRTTPPP